MDRSIKVTDLRALLASLPVEDSVIRETPARFLNAFAEMTSGYLDDPAELLSTVFPAPSSDLIVLKDIEFTSLCEHHLMPFSGVAHVGYIPGVSVVGLSKLARLVDCFARRLQIQERMCSQIAAMLSSTLADQGSAACVIEASHGCMCYRGVRKARATFLTMTMLGAFRSDPALRTEFLTMIAATHSRV
jgi:GTP cyclohydrolase I